MTRATVCVCGFVSSAVAITFLIVLFNLFILLGDLPLQIVNPISLRFYCFLEVFDGLCEIFNGANVYSAVCYGHI